MYVFFKEFAQVLTNLRFNQFKQLFSRTEPPIHRFYFGTLLNFNFKQVPIIRNTECLLLYAEKLYYIIRNDESYHGEFHPRLNFSYCITNSEHW